MVEAPTIEHVPSVYIPMDRRHALARGESLPDRTSGAALFADISGFTALTEALTRIYGPKIGAEELTHQLNRVYDALIAEVNRYGGSVIGFAGDAITCWFGEETGVKSQELRVKSQELRVKSQESRVKNQESRIENREISDSQLATPNPQPTSPCMQHPASCRAVVCALAMQCAMEQFKTVALPGGETASLAVKAAIASGPARRFLIGDKSIQFIDALAGETLVRMVAAEHLANRGDVIVDAQTVRALGHQLQIKEWRTAEESGEAFAVVQDIILPDQPIETFEGEVLQALPDATVKSWLLPDVYEDLSAGVGESLEMRRGVVALFLRFQGIDYDGDEEAGEKLDRYIRWVQQTITRYDGALLQLIIGDKGNYLYATFGAPSAHENDPQRAVSAALHLIDPPEDLDFVGPIQIGISQGAMRTGAYGGTTRRTYGAIGDDVNLAARLMQNAAPGEVLVSKYVQEQSAHDFKWDILPAIRVKGKEAPVPVARPTQSTQRGRTVAYTSQLVGREIELAQLMAALQPIFDGAFGGAVYVYGEAGVGKSRLIYELRLRMMMEGSVSWFTCPAEPILRQSLNPFKYFLRQHFNQNTDNAEETNKANFQAIIGGITKTLQASGDSAELVAELERTRWMLGAMVDLHEEGSLYEQLEPELRFRNTLIAFKTLIQAESIRQPVILHIEDAHWLDSDSQELLNVLTQNVSAYPFAVLLSGRYRDDGTPFQVNVNDSVLQQAIDLNTLSPEGTRALAGQVLQGEVSESLGAFLAHKTEGNPLFVEQLTLDLRERKLVQRRNDVWTIASREIDTVPATINAVLIARLDRLAAQVKAVVQTAAVLGREFEVQILSHMLRDDANLPYKVQRAEEEMIWQALSEMRYIFRHTMMRDAAYDMQLQARLRDMHALAGQVMAQVYAAELGPHYADLAYHYGKAEDVQQEFRYAKLAGEYAASQYANQEAIEHYQQALQSLSRLKPDKTVGHRQSVHTALAEIQVTTGHYDEAHEHLEKALALSIQRNDEKSQVHICRWMAQMYELRGEYAEALEWIQKGSHILQDQESSDAAELRLIAGLIQTRQGHYDEATMQFQNALHIAQNLDEASALARAHNGLGVIRLRDDARTAIDHFQQAFTLYEQAGDIPGQAKSNNLLANAYFDTGQWDKADYHYRRARETFEQIGDVYNGAFIDNNLGGIAINQGRLDEALTFYQKALEAMEQIGGSIYVLGVLHMNLGHVLIRRGEIENARAELQTGQEYFEKAQVRDFLPELCRHCAEAELAAGALAEAEARAYQALELARELEMRGEEGYTLRVLGEVSSTQSKFNLAEEQLVQSITILEEMEDEYQAARSQLALAQLYARQNKAASVQQALDQCRPVFERLGAALDLEIIQKLKQQLKE